MTEKFENQQVMSSTAVAIVLGAECQSFANWPQGKLPSYLIVSDEGAVESKFSEHIDLIRAGKCSKKAKQALDAVHGAHPIIPTVWGSIRGRTFKCATGSKMVHTVEIHASTGWDLDTPEFWEKFGMGIEFSPYGDLAIELIRAEVHAFNEGVKDYPIEVAVGDEYCLLEFSCKFKKTSDGAEDMAAFARLMQFTESLFENGRMDQIIAQACDPSVLKRAMVSMLWSTKVEKELGALKKISGAKAKLCKYENLPVLSNPSVAAALMEINVVGSAWPKATMPDELVAIYKSRLAGKVSAGFPSIGVRERSRIVKEAIGELLEPRPLLRTSWGMVRLTQYIVEGLGEDRGMYCLRIYSEKGWNSVKCADWSERAALLLEDRTRHLLNKSAAHPVEISACDEYGILDISCDFSLAGGADVAGEAEIACQNALADYAFYICATDVLDHVLTDACSEKPIIFVEEPVAA